MSGVEITFWKDLIEKYLHPIDADKQREKKIAEGLTELRNKSVFFFSVFNALFVLIVFMLTLHKDTLHIDWPFGVKENITITEDEQVINSFLVFQSLGHSSQSEAMSGQCSEALLVIFLALFIQSG